jgi:hypothetical protein
MTKSVHAQTSVQNVLREIQRNPRHVPSRTAQPFIDAGAVKDNLTGIRISLLKCIFFVNTRKDFQATPSI